METVLMIIGYTLVTGSYAYTWKSMSRLWQAIDSMRANDLKHFERRLKALEDK